MTTSFQAVAAIKPAWTDRIGMAVLDTLKSSDEGRLVAFAEGRLKRIVTLPYAEGIVGPMILVKTHMPRPVTEGVGACTELIATVSVGVIYDQNFSFLEDDEQTVASVFAEIQRALVANYGLRVPRFGNRALVDRIRNFNPGPEGGKVVRESSVTLLEWIDVEYQATINGTLWDLE